MKVVAVRVEPQEVGAGNDPGRLVVAVDDQGRAEFVTERPTGGQFTHEPGGILADEMGVRQCENPNSRRFFDTAEK